jgi:glutamate 5-kinase
VSHRSCHRLVVKVGSNTLTAGGDSLNRPGMLELVRQLVGLVKEGREVVLVSSGAIAAGREALGLSRHGRDIPFKQVLAAVGQTRLMQAWDQLFSLFGVTIAQTLLTRADLADRQGYLNARNTLIALLERHVVPVVNENDVVAVEEIRIGDNDNLSALVANLIDADLLVLLTDQAGLYTADPRRDPSATLIAEVPVISQSILALAEGAGTARGTGGMLTKVHAARVATESGVSVVIADGSSEDVLRRAADGEPVGTRFPTGRGGLESRKRWIVAGLAGRAAIRIDAGAAAALRRGRSLLPAGITETKGPFDRGDSVNIVGPDGKTMGCGVVNYGAADLERIKGRRSAQIAQLLGYHYGDEAIHRNNVVML